MLIRGSMPRPGRPAHRPIWIATFAATTTVVVLLHQVLLPFVAGMVLAYLLDPLANRIERLGVNRAVATLAIIAFAVALIWQSVFQRPPPPHLPRHLLFAVLAFRIRWRALDLRRRPCVVALAHASNAFGFYDPVRAPRGHG
jgi:hypothetical protein